MNRITFDVGNQECIICKKKVMAVNNGTVYQRLLHPDSICFCNTSDANARLNFAMELSLRDPNLLSSFRKDELIDD